MKYHDPANLNAEQLKHNNKIKKHFNSSLIWILIGMLVTLIGLAMTLHTIKFLTTPIWMICGLWIVIAALGLYILVSVAIEIIKLKRKKD